MFKKQAGHQICRRKRRRRMPAPRRGCHHQNVISNQPRQSLDFIKISHKEIISEISRYSYQDKRRIRALITKYFTQAIASTSKRKASSANETKATSENLSW